jgi:hypothetical protein
MKLGVESKLLCNAGILGLYRPHKGKFLNKADAWLAVPSDVPRDLTDRVDELAEKRWRRNQRKRTSIFFPDSVSVIRLSLLARVSSITGGVINVARLV